MALLSYITGLINSNIRNKTTPIIKTEHADVEQAIANELYPTLTTETQAAAGIFTLTGALFSTIEYRISIKKSGNTVYISGTIKNPTSLSYGGGATVTTPIIVVANTDYRVKTGVTFVSTSDRLIYKDTGIFLNIPLPAGTTIRFNDTYTTND